jgi:regulatory protein
MALAASNKRNAFRFFKTLIWRGPVSFPFRQALLPEFRLNLRLQSYTRKALTRQAPAQSMFEEAKKKPKISDPQLGLEKGMAYCAYQERCQQEVRDKLYEWGLWPDAVENILAELISQNFLNEERFAMAYAGGKFRIKKWGRVKIKIELQKRRISPYCIRKGLSVIDDADYLTCLRNVLQEYAKKLKEKHPLKRRYKIMRYAQSRGFEQDLIRTVMSEETQP